MRGLEGQEERARGLGKPALELPQAPFFWGNSQVLPAQLCPTWAPGP